jgi:hypothetical protein
VDLDDVMLALQHYNVVNCGVAGHNILVCEDCLSTCWLGKVRSCHEKAVGEVEGEQLQAIVYGGPAIENELKPPNTPSHPQTLDPT